MCDAFSSNLGTMILALWAISECTKFGCQRSHVGHEGPRGPIFCKYAKCFFSYRLYSTKFRLCRITTMVVVPSGCSGFFGPRSQMGHMGHFMKSCKMLLLLQIVWYYVEVVSHYYYGSGTFGVFRIFWSKVPDGPFYEIMQNTSSPTDCMLHCWGFVTLVLWKWYHLGVQHFGVQGAKRAI